MSRYTETIFISEYITKSKDVKGDCFAITFKIPSGGNSVNINGVIINANESLEITQPEGCIDRTRYHVLFISGTGNDSLEISRIVPKNEPNEIGV